MDITQIIITVGIVIAGLLVLWAVIGGIFAVIAKRSFDKQSEKMRRDFDEWPRMRRF